MYPRLAIMQFSGMCDRWRTGFRGNVRTTALRDHLTAFRSRDGKSLERLTGGLGGLLGKVPRLWAAARGLLASARLITMWGARAMRTGTHGVPFTGRAR